MRTREVIRMYGLCSHCHTRKSLRQLFGRQNGVRILFHTVTGRRIHDAVYRCEVSIAVVL